MGVRSYGWGSALGASTAGMLLCLHATTLLYRDPYSADLTLLNSPVASLQDVIGVTAGLRRLSSDIAWIQTLQYYGATEANATEEDEHNASGKYPLFLAYCERVARIDPHFIYVYYYGGGVLGWNLNRLNEADALIRLGITNNPTEWRLSQYLAALAYQKNHDPQKLVEFLHSFVTQPDCPNILRALLANLYKKQHLYPEAINVWLLVAQTNSQGDISRALKEIQILRNLMGRNPNRPA